MNVSEITAQLYAISKALVEKTGEKPWIAPKLEIYDDKCGIDLMREYKTSGRNDYMVGTAKGNTPEDAIADAYITPLVAVKTAMTDNLLTVQP